MSMPIAFVLLAADLNVIRLLFQEFCRYDDYNWDWSLNFIGTSCTESKLKVMVMKSPRIYHIGEWYEAFAFLCSVGICKYWDNS